MIRDRMYEKILDVISKLSDIAAVDLWNRFTEVLNRPDDRIYPMEELNDELSGMEPSAIIRLAYFGGINPADDWFWYDSYENLASTDYLRGKRSPFDPVSIAEYMLDSKDALGDQDIEKVLEGR